MFCRIPCAKGWSELQENIRGRGGSQWIIRTGHVGAGALTRPGGDFFRAAEGNLLSHTCHSEERRDESLLSNTCHSESALAVRNLLFKERTGMIAAVPRVSLPLRDLGWEKLSIHPVKLSSLSDFQE